MDARLQNRIQRYGWDAASEHYEDGWRGPLQPAQATLIEFAAVAPGERIIEVACGSGLVTRDLAAATGPAGRVLATDLSQKMVERTAGACADAKMPWVETARMGGDELDVAEGSFDLAVSALGLMYMPEPRRALAAMGRAVRAGGRVVATVWGERRRCGWAEIFPIVDARVASEVCPLFFGCGAKDALRRDFESAGLVDLRERRQQEQLAFADERALLDAMLIGGPVALAVKRFTPEVLAEVEAEFLASVRDWRSSDGSYRMPGEFVTVAGLKL
jgi:SAM-dependent methyltransferase